MSSKMSQEEINMLINDFSSNSEETQNVKIVSNSNNGGKGKGDTSLYKTIDFRKLNKLQYENLGALKQIHEQFAKMLNSYFTMFLRISIQAEVDFELVEQLTYQQYVATSKKNSLWGVYSTSSFEESEGRCSIQFDSAFCDFFIDRSFGGSADFESIGEEEVKMSDINKEMSKPLFSNVLNIYEQAWNNSNIMDFKMSLLSIEDNSQNLNLGIITSEIMLVIPIQITIFQKSDDDETEAKRSIFRIGIPYSVIEPVLDKLNLSNLLLSHQSDKENATVKAGIQRMSNLAEVFVGESTIPFLDLLYLEKDDVIFLNKKVKEPYDVNIGGIKKYEAMPHRLRDTIYVKIVK